MMEWVSGIWGNLVGWWYSLTWTAVGLGIGVFVGSIAITIVAVVIVVVKIPENYFSTHYQEDFLPNSPFLVRWGALIAKNILGVLLIAVGIVLSLPTVPGPGFVVIFIGLIMLDIPGKRPLEARIIKRPTVSSVLNRIRARYGKPPLVLD